MKIVEVNVSLPNHDNVQVVVTCDDLSYTVNCFVCDDGIYVGSTMFITRYHKQNNGVSFEEGIHASFQKKVPDLKAVLGLVREWHASHGSKP